MTAFDRAWNIAKENRFQRRMKDIGRGRRSLPKDTKFSDLRSTSDEKDTRPIVPRGVPINILDLPNYRPDPGEEKNQEVVRRIMGTKDYNSAVDLIDQMKRERMEAESAERQGHVNMPKSLIERTRRAGRTPKND